MTFTHRISFASTTMYRLEPFSKPNEMIDFGGPIFSGDGIPEHMESGTENIPIEPCTLQEQAHGHGYRARGVTEDVNFPITACTSISMER